VIGTPVDKLDFSGELVGVKEAAELAGKDKANFLRDLASREDFPEPIVSLASGRYWLSAEIERYLRKEKVAG
jgi:predicted ABC-class ATPase